MPAPTRPGPRTAWSGVIVTNPFAATIFVLCAAAGVATFQRVAAQQVPAENVGYLQGNPGAAVRVIELLDFGCPACALFAAGAYAEVRDRYVRTGRVRWQTIPFVTGSFRHSSEAARAAVCAGQQDAFWPMHDLLFKERNAWIQSGDPDRVLLEFARGLTLDPETFQSCYRSRATRGEVDRYTLTARHMRVRGTPTLVIDGELVAGALDASTLGRRIEARLGR